MKIINAVLKDNNLTITLDANANVSKVYLDSVLNQNSMYSDEDTKHTHTITDKSIREVCFNFIILSCSIISIKIRRCSNHSQYI